MKNEEKYFSGSQVRALSAHRSGAPDATLCAIWAPWELLKKCPTFRLFEWVRPSGFVDAARKGPIEPNSKSLSQGDPLDRAEKSGDPTTFFRGQEVRKVASTCPYFP